MSRPHVEVLGVGAEDDVQLSGVPDNMHCRFFQERKQRIGRAKKLGYRPVTAEDGIELIGLEAEEGADGLIRDGDRILMICDKAKYRERQKQKRKLSRIRLEGPKQQFRQKVRKAEAQTRQSIPVTTTFKDNLPEED